MQGPDPHCNTLQRLLDKCAAGERLELALDTLEAIGGELCRVNAKIRQTICVIVGDARRLFANDAEWAAWIDRTFKPSNASDRCHLIAVGRLLTGLRDKGDCIALQCYCEIFVLSFQKLLVLTQLPLEQVPAFVSHTPEIAKMDRGQLRNAVAVWLGEAAPATAKVQPLLPGFDEALDAIVAIDEEEIFKISESKGFDQKMALKMSYSGATLCQASIGYIADHIDEVDAEMLDELASAIEMIHSRLSGAITDQRRKLLGNQ